MARGEHTAMTQPQEAKDDDYRALQGLNARFFSRSPAEHFRTRALSLIYLEDTRRNTAQIVEKDSLRQRVEARLPGMKIDLNAQETGFESSFDEFLTVECFMLKHHFGESLLRNFFALLDAHESFPPWLAMAHAQEPGGFRRRLNAFLGLSGEALNPILEWAFIGSRSALEESVGIGGVEKHEENVRQWLRHFARFHLETAFGYNAAKHGLGTVAAQTNVSIRANDSDPSVASIVLLEDNTLETLEYTRGKTKGELVWSQVTRTVDIPGVLSQVLVGTKLLDSLWSIAKARFLKEGANILVFDGPSVSEVSRGAKPGGNFRVEVAVTRAEQPTEA